VTSTGTGNNITVSNLDPGTYTFTVTDASLCVSPATGNVVINAVPPSPSAPVVGTRIQPTCDVATGSVTLNGLPSSGTWTLTRNPGNLTTSGTGTSITITGLAANTYNFTITNAGGCISQPSANVVINIQPSTPVVPSIAGFSQPTCTVETGSIVLSGLPATGTWTLNPGGRTGTGTSTTISQLGPGTYAFRVTNDDGCTSAESASVIINPQPATPSAPLIGTITHPSCLRSIGGVEVGGLPATGTWTLTCLPVNLVVTGTGTTYSENSIPAGTYTYTVSNSAGCVSPVSASFVIREQPPTPTAPSPGTISPPTCKLATGSAAFNGLPATGTWTLTRYPGTFITRGTGTSSTVSDIATGTYNFTVTNQYGCISLPSSNVVIPAQPPTPSAPVIVAITQPTIASPSGKVEFSGLPPTGRWKLARLPDLDHVVLEGSGVNYTITGLAGGNYTFTVTNSYGCTSEESVEVAILTAGKPDLTVNDPPAVCYPATVDLTAPGVTSGSASGLAYTYWTNPEATIECSDPSAVTAGTYYIKGTNAFGFFNIKPVTATIEQMPVPNAGPDQVLSLIFSSTLEAELGENETGVWSVESGTAVFEDATDPETIVSNLSPGNNFLSWSVTRGVCPADSDKVLIFVGDVTIPTMITPNGDSQNEYLEIMGLESLGKTELVVFDRRGAEVFKVVDYDNKWNGVDYNENPLPSDTYFYLLKAGNGRSYSGYVVIRR
jgi:gliding motility-associated-like protein